jgi:N-methylhydantoinase A/oxoprolinase/acetone carboxylase beta subunit
MTSDPALYLGIDTGGTFTDGVLLDPATHRVVRSAKVLTTHHDLRQCIANVLDALLPAGSPPVALASLSTTLATNAIVEGKHKPVALFLLGYDPELVYKFEFDRQFGTQHFAFIEGRHDVEGRQQVPLDEAALLRRFFLRRLAQPRARGARRRIDPLVER